MPFTYDYPRPMVTVDILLCRPFPGSSSDCAPTSADILLIERKHEPFKGCWALPGGYVGMEESLEEAARRELQEETGIRGVELQQLGAVGDPGRDPRGPTVTILYGAVMAQEQPQGLRAEDDAARLAWFASQRLPSLAFDHARLISRFLPILLRAPHKTLDIPK